MVPDPPNHRVFIARQNRLMVVDENSGKLLGEVTGINGFASTADGKLMVIHQDTPDEYHVIQDVPTPERSRNIGLDPANHRVFVVSAKFGPTPEGKRARPPVLPNSFTLMVIERETGER